MRYKLSLTLTTSLVLGVLFPALSEAQNCPQASSTPPRNNHLYLYFPTTADSTFPEYYGTYGVNTSPAAAFNVADLDSSIGTTAQLRQRIFDIVKWDYCEFDVDLKQSTTAPSPSEARWQVVAIGSDSATHTLLGTVFGLAQDVDLNDADVKDYARIWAKSFKTAYGGTGGALAGTNSTPERWATAIGETVAHEAGHNYGLDHAYSSSKPGEDSVTNHILATGSTLTGEIRASRNRHFSDTSYQILGHNIGLNWNTLHNWDFTNPNSTDAHSLTLRILSKASSLTIGWWFNHPTSPWINPTISSAGTQTLKSQTYNAFDLVYSVDNPSWNTGGGAPGVVRPAVKFHVGAAFNQSDAVIVYEATLKNSGGSALPLKPRVVGYNAGALDLASGDFAITLFNTNPGDGALIVEDLQIQYLPRIADIHTMVGGATLTDIGGQPITPLPPPRLPISENAPRRDERFGVPGQRIVVEGNAVLHVDPIEVRDDVTARVAGLAANRHVDVTLHAASDCEPGFKQTDGPFDVASGEFDYCTDGTALSLFPSTTVYVTATVIDPDAKQWDPVTNSFVTGPLETKVFFQVAGFVPDLNDNGVDDLIDIRKGTSEDTNGNGVVDEVDRTGRAWSIHAGTVDPHGVLNTAFDGDFTLNLDYVRSINRRWDWDLRLGLSRFDAKGGIPRDLDVWNLSGNLKYTLNPGAPLRTFVNGGLGAYYLDPPGDLEGGYNIGVGLAVPLSPTITGELTYNYHETVTATPDIKFGKLQLGLLFSF